jgi:glycosyltransferase involved in cell wall biosynthesis
VSPSSRTVRPPEGLAPVGRPVGPAPPAPAPAGRTRVLQVIARLNIGGPAPHATLLTERLDPARYDSRLVTGVEAPAEGNYLDLHGKAADRVTVLPSLGREIRGLADVEAFLRLLGFIRQVRPHVVHTHTAKAGTLGRLAAWVAGVPVVVHTYHGHVFHGYFSPARTRLFVAIERWLARRTDRLVAVSETVRRELLALGIGSAERMCVIPYGLDLEPFLAADGLRGQLRSELGLPAGAPLVGIVARLVPVKAHEVFLEAAARLVRAVPASRFLVVGDGERRPALEALAARLGLAEAVRFLGWRRDLARLYADLDLVVLTSRNEGAPFSLIEAMAAARPVVSTRVGGVPDLVEDGLTGCLVPSGDADALAAAMGALLGDPGRRQALGAAGRKRVAGVFTAERMLGDVDRLYTELLFEKRPARGSAAP